MREKIAFCSWVICHVMVCLKGCVVFKWVSVDLGAMALNTISIEKEKRRWAKISKKFYIYQMGNPKNIGL